MQSEGSPGSQSVIDYFNRVVQEAMQINALKLERACEQALVQNCGVFVVTDSSENIVTAVPNKFVPFGYIYSAPQSALDII